MLKRSRGIGRLALELQRLDRSMDLIMYQIYGQSLKYDLYLEQVLGDGLREAFEMQREAKRQIERMFKNVRLGKDKKFHVQMKSDSRYHRENSKIIKKMLAPSLKKSCKNISLHADNLITDFSVMRKIQGQKN